MTWRGALVALAVGCAACTSLPDIESNVCGNAVLEYDNDEDCDTFVDFEGGSCRPAGTIGECHFDCRRNADESRASVTLAKVKPTAASFAESMKKRFGAHADAILKAYPATTDAETIESAAAMASDTATATPPIPHRRPTRAAVTTIAA